MRRLIATLFDCSPVHNDGNNHQRRSGRVHVAEETAKEDDLHPSPLYRALLRRATAVLQGTCYYLPQCSRVRVIIYRNAPGYVLLSTAVLQGRCYYLPQCSRVRVISLSLCSSVRVIIYRSDPRYVLSLYHSAAVYVLLSTAVFQGTCYLFTAETSIIYVWQNSKVVTISFRQCF